MSDQIPSNELQSLTLDQATPKAEAQSTPSPQINGSASEEGQQTPKAGVEKTVEEPTKSTPTLSIPSASRPAPLPPAKVTGGSTIIAKDHASPTPVSISLPSTTSTPTSSASNPTARPNGLPSSSASASPSSSSGPRTPGLPSTTARTGVPPRAPLGSGAGGLAGIRRAGAGGAAGGGGGATKIPPGLQAKMDAMAKNRAAAAAAAAGGTLGSGTATGASGGTNGSTPSLDPTGMSSLLASAATSSRLTAPTPSPRPPALGGLAARRAAAAASGSGGGSASSSTTPLLGPGGLSGRAPPSGLPGMGGLSSSGSAFSRMSRPGMPGMTLSSLRGGDGGGGGEQGQAGSTFSSFGKIVDASGKLNFESKAVIHDKGVDFSNGKSILINMDEMELEGELGKGNYGTVQKVLHKPTKVVMAMKEIHLELDNSKMNAIIMELDILHRAVAPEIVDFYGAFTIESNVYYCMEYMDAGSLDVLYLAGVPEDVLARITRSMVKGLGFLKDELQVMHRDVKPTNVLVNKAGQVKLVDFGVSGQLEKSLAKTNIGCQSYMAPERIKGESQNNLGTYTVSSDVWSVGLSIIELAKGTYPYPPETFANVFAQLQAIVYGPAPTLPEGYSAVAHDFVAQCLRKQPEMRPTYAQLLKHPWMLEDDAREVDMVGWVERALAAKAEREKRGGGSVSSSAPEVKDGHALGAAGKEDERLGGKAVTTEAAKGNGA